MISYHRVKTEQNLLVRNAAVNLWSGSN